MSSNPQTATFLFTDLEDSTPLWDDHPEIMQELSERHDAILREAIESHRGCVIKTTGDGFHAVFEAASDAVAAALAAQQAFIAEPWPADTGPLRVRMGVHTGESRLRDTDYYGPDVNRAARVMGLAHGGQVLLSEATATLIRNIPIPGLSLIDLGEHRLKGLAAAERIFQVQHPTLPAEFPPLKSLSVYKHNLPVQLSTFVGREKEMADIGRLLKETHLLTLVGPGGTGKTRLMLQSAEEMIGDFVDGVWLVELAPLPDPNLIPERVAAVLSVQEQPGRPLVNTLVDYLRHKELLLLLDNVEHLVRESAQFAEHLLSHCPKVKFLVTGREALFIRGEVTLQIPSLSLPPANGDPALGNILASEGVQLFVARAQEIRPDFELGPGNAARIAEIVRHLDGIPLAIELAAARLRMLTVDQIAERLSDRFRLLTGGSRSDLPRMQTLQAMIDWSWNLLTDKERVLLRRLSVFSGGWSLEAAQAVASDGDLNEYDVFDLLEQLVNKSLVTVKFPAEGEARYGMLESIRQYSLQRLADAGEEAALRERHASYFVAFAEEAEPNLTQPTMLLWINRLSLELDNLRAAQAWTLEEQPELALRLGGALLSREASWITPGEARSWLEPAVEKTRPLLANPDANVRTVDFIKALTGLAVANGIQGRSEEALALANESIQLAREAGELHLLVYAIALKSIQVRFNMPLETMQEVEEAIAICRENGYVVELAWIANSYAIALQAQGKPDLAVPYFQLAGELAGTIEDVPDVSMIETQARLAEINGNLDEAKRYLLRAIERYDATKYRRGIVLSQSGMAHILRREGKLEEAERYYRKSIVGWQELGHQSAVAHQLECLAFIAIERGHYVIAARLLGAAEEARQRLNAFSDDPQEIEELTQALDRLAEVMGLEERDKAMAEGQRINLDEAVRIALDEKSEA